jgi:hypothetical protein
MMPEFAMLRDFGMPVGQCGKGRRAGLFGHQIFKVVGCLAIDLLKSIIRRRGSL